MYIQVEQGGATLTDADNFRAFAVVAPAGQDGLAEALDGVGTLDGDHVWVDADAVKRLAGDQAGERWLAGFDSMVAYAASKGWTDDAGRVRAHIEYRD